ncbi:glycosyltransferase family 2 protein [Streptomyces sp. NPDC001822]|uniref:glycosyltransferase family 2 protein n=1 Tax=unclassified Streptomyces TaxID=2593676 RepID=UPI002E2DC400|nr:glycosyltransferase family 2 protein [Streptomyces sp. NBC_00178]
MSKLPIAVAIPTKNEGLNIAEAVKSVLGHFEAVVVVDSHSTDDTAKIAEECGAEVVTYTWDGGHPRKKQWCLENVRTDLDWILLLDGDERLSPGLLAELRRIFADPAAPKPAAYDIPLGYWFSGKRLRHGYTIRKRSLTDRTRCHYPEVGDLAAPGIGEVEGHYQPVAATAEALSSPIEHQDLDPVTAWFERHNRYSDWEAWLEHHPDVKEQVRKVKSRQGQLFHKAPFKPLVSFAYMYVYRRGFLDGRAGLDFALAMSFYRWQIALKSREGKTG